MKSRGIQFWGSSLYKFFGFSVSKNRKDDVSYVLNTIALVLNEKGYHAGIDYTVVNVSDEFKKDAVREVINFNRDFDVEDFFYQITCNLLFDFTISYMVR